MNEYQKAIKRGIEKGLDKHFKDEPKVCLTIDEAKQVQQEFLDIVCEIVRALGYHGVKFVKPASLIMLEERIEQAEGKK